MKKIDVLLLKYFGYQSVAFKGHNTNELKMLKRYSTATYFITKLVICKRGLPPFGHSTATLISKVICKICLSRNCECIAETIKSLIKSQLQHIGNVKRCKSRTNFLKHSWGNHINFNNTNIIGKRNSFQTLNVKSQKIELTYYTRVVDLQVLSFSRARIGQGRLIF